MISVTQDVGTFSAYGLGELCPTAGQYECAVTIQIFSLLQAAFSEMLTQIALDRKQARTHLASLAEWAQALLRSTGSRKV